LLGEGKNFIDQAELVRKYSPYIFPKGSWYLLPLSDQATFFHQLILMLLFGQPMNEYKALPRERGSVSQVLAWLSFSIFNVHSTARSENKLTQLWLERDKALNISRMINLEHIHGHTPIIRSNLLAPDPPQPLLSSLQAETFCCFWSWQLPRQILKY
jgi:hypothetical protein